MKFFSCRLSKLPLCAKHVSIYHPLVVMFCLKHAYGKTLDSYFQCISDLLYIVFLLNTVVFKRDSDRDGVVPAPIFACSGVSSEVSRTNRTHKDFVHEHTKG